VCVLAAGAWRCVPAQDESRLPSERSFACDDATDCPDPLNPKNGPTCCVADGFRDERTTCGYRDEVDGDPCTLEVCNGDPGAAACPGGLVCKDEHCRPATPPRATCGKGARCPSEAPVCRWESGAGTCVTTAEAAGLRQDLLDKGPDGRPSVFACTKPSDCGAGQTCCADSAVQVPPGEIALTECRRACGTTVFHNVCETGKDCPAFFSTGAGGGASRQQCAKLAPSGRHPVWAGECHVAGVP
jgi:hypothetical protein